MFICRCLLRNRAHQRRAEEEKTKEKVLDMYIGTKDTRSEDQNSQVCFADFKIQIICAVPNPVDLSNYFPNYESSIWTNPPRDPLLLVNNNTTLLTNSARKRKRTSLETVSPVNSKVPPNSNLWIPYNNYYREPCPPPSVLHPNSQARTHRKILNHGLMHYKLIPCPVLHLAPPTRPPGPQDPERVLDLVLGKWQQEGGELRAGQEETAEAGEGEAQEETQEEAQAEIRGLGN
jgi:hypothetical protein